LIDLHLHTTASDGTLAPAALVDRARAVGLRTLSVTDHDTMAGVPEAAEAAASHGLEFFPGIEITAVSEQREIHMLGYFLDQSPPGLEPFLEIQRSDRFRRAREMAKLLADLGAPIDIDGLISQATAEERTLTRPMVARALMDAGHVSSEQEAFHRWIRDGGPAYVVRQAVSPAEVVRLISRAGGVSALAHPGLLGRDDLIPSLAKTGLGAIEVYHSGHDAKTRAHYARLAAQHELASSGGSDYHGESHHRAKSLGVVTLPREAFMQLSQRFLLAHSVTHGA